MTTLHCSDCSGQSLRTTLKRQLRASDVGCLQYYCFERCTENNVGKYHDKWDKSEDLPRVCGHEIGTDFQRSTNVYVRFIFLYNVTSYARNIAKICERESERWVYSRTGRWCSRNHQKKETKKHVDSSLERKWNGCIQYMRKFMSIRNRIRSNLISICHCEVYIGGRSYCSFMSVHILQVKITITWEHSAAEGTTLRLVTTCVISIHFIISITYSRIYYTVCTLKRDRCTE